MGLFKKIGNWFDEAKLQVMVSVMIRVVKKSAEGARGPVIRRLQYRATLLDAALDLAEREGDFRVWKAIQLWVITAVLDELMTDEEEAEYRRMLELDNSHLVEA